MCVCVCLCACLLVCLLSGCLSLSISHPLRAQGMSHRHCAKRIWKMYLEQPYPDNLHIIWVGLLQLLLLSLIQLSAMNCHPVSTLMLPWLGFRKKEPDNKKPGMTHLLTYFVYWSFKQHYLKFWSTRRRLGLKPVFLDLVGAYHRGLCLTFVFFDCIWSLILQSHGIVFFWSFDLGSQTLSNVAWSCSVISLVIHIMWQWHVSRPTENGSRLCGIIKIN